MTIDNFCVFLGTTDKTRNQDEKFKIKCYSCEKKDEALRISTDKEIDNLAKKKRQKSH